ncbi:glycosyltransferase [Phaeospirillum tilakii]|uniref:Glycosyltransferase n=1 Tax=Phaeospirillum tilakii TaxID=741673 RepID=A0ABW5CFC7_9PROT
MRVVLAGGSLGPGGAERQLVLTAQELAADERVAAITVLCQNLTAARADFYRPALVGLDRCRVIEFLPEASPARQAIPGNLESLSGILPPWVITEICAYARWFRHEQIDVVQCWQDHINVTAGLGALVAGIPRIVLNCRNSSPPFFAYFQPWMWDAYRVLLASPSVAAMVNSRAGAEDYAAWLHLPPDRFRVVPNAFAPSFYRQPEAGAGAALRRDLGVAPAARLVGAIFRLADEKDPGLWLEVASRLARRDPGVEFVIFGDGILRPSVEVAARTALGNRIRLPGLVPDALIALSCLDLFLLTSRQEGLPNVLLESQWMGVPVVATAVGGCAEAILPGGGTVVGRDPALLAEACEHWLAAPRPDRAALRAAVEARFSPAAMGAATWAAFSTPPDLPLALTRSDQGGAIYQPIAGSLLVVMGFQSPLGDFARELEAVTALLPSCSGRIRMIVGPNQADWDEACLRFGPNPRVALERWSEQGGSSPGTGTLSAVLAPERFAWANQLRGSGQWARIANEIAAFRPERLCVLSAPMFAPGGVAGLAMGVERIDLVPPEPRRIWCRPPPAEIEVGAAVADGRVRLLPSTCGGTRRPVTLRIKRLITRGKGAVVHLGHRLAMWIWRTRSHLPGVIPALLEALSARSLREFWAAALACGGTEGKPSSRRLLVVGTLGPGGAERQAMLTLIGLHRRRDHPYALLGQYLDAPGNRFFLPQIEQEGIDVYLPMPDPDDKEAASSVTAALAEAERLPLSLKQIGGFLRAFDRLKPELVHLWLDDINVKAGLAAVAAGVPRILLSTRSLPPYRFSFFLPYMRPAYRLLANAPGVVMLNNSEAGARAYERWLGLPPGRITVVRNGFDFAALGEGRRDARRQEYRRTLGLAESVPLLGTVIRLGVEKRPLLWLDIAQAVRRSLPDCHFLIVGDGPLRQTAEEHARRAGLADAVHFVGHQRDTVAAMAAMDLFLLTSATEGLPNVLIEAQAIGTPVVTTPAGGAGETLAHGETGWLLERDDAPHAAEVVLRLLRDPEWRRRAGEQARAFVRQRFGLERMLAETLALYPDQSSNNNKT